MNNYDNAPHRPGELELGCDTCDRTATFRGPTWFKCVSQSEAAGWQGYDADDGSWGHRCPECAAKPLPEKPMTPRVPAAASSAASVVNRHPRGDGR